MTDVWRLTLVGITACSVAVTARAQDWPMARHDAQRTAHQAVGVDIEEPGELSHLGLGGSPTGRAFWVRDADGDGEEEVYIVAGGRIISLSATGSVRWASQPLGFTEIRGFLDVDGDNRLELVASAVRVFPVVFDALSGTQRWQATLGAGQAVGDVFPMDADRDGRSELFISEFGGASRGVGTGRIYAFPAGFEGPPTVVALHTSAHGYWYGIGSTVADVDGNGQDEIVALSNDRVVAYDAVTGEARWRTPTLGSFPFGIGVLNAVDVDGDGRDEVVAMSNNAASGGGAAKRLMLIELEGGSFASRWEMRFDANLAEHLFIRDDVGVLRSGELPSIVTTVLDPDTLEHRVLVVPGDSVDGTPTAVIAGRIMLAMSDLDGDGIREILTVDAPGIVAPQFGTVRALSLQTTGSFEELFRIDDSHLVLQQLGFLSRLDTVVQAGGQPLVFMDTDGDARGDVVTSLDGSAAYTVPPGTNASSVRTASSGRLWVGLSDGRIGELDAGLSILNDVEPDDGLPDLSFSTYATSSLVTATDGSRVLVALVDARGAPVVYDLSAGISEVWRSADHVAGARPRMTWLPGTRPTLAYSAREPDGTLALVARHADGSELVRIPYGGGSSLVPMNDLVPLRDGSDALLGLAGAALSRQSGEVIYQLFDLGTGTRQDLDLNHPLLAGAFPITPFDWDGDGTEDAVSMQRDQVRVASGTTGMRLFDQVLPPVGGMWSFVDLDGDGSVDGLRQGAFGYRNGNPGKGVRRTASDMSSVDWIFDADNFEGPVAMARQSSGRMHLGVTRTREAWFGVVDSDGALLGSAIPAAGTFYISAAAARTAGAEPGQLTASVAVAPHSAARPASFMFGSSDGYLYAARATDGGLLWAFPLRSSVGEPVPTDIDGDGQSELLVSAGDGNVHIIGPARLETPTEIRDDDGSTTTSPTAADIDQITVSTRVGSHWDAVDGATGYEVQLVREDSFIVVPWVDVRGQLRTTFDDVSLEVGPRYSSVVRAYDRSGTRSRVSGERSSDGVVVADNDGPSIELSADPALFSTSAMGIADRTSVHLVAHDAVGLRRYAIRVETASGLPTLGVLAAGPASGTERIVDMQWAGAADRMAMVLPGRYAIVAEAEDIAGNLVEDRVEVLVCGGRGSDFPCPDTSDAGSIDGGVPDGGEIGTLAGGGGCGCRASSSEETRIPWFLPLAVAGWVLRIRRAL